MAEPGQSQLVFELGGGSTAGSQELLGAWSLAPTRTAETVRFGARSSPPPNGAGSSPTLWRADLPRDPRLAARRLAIASEHLATCRQALVQATIRLDAACRSTVGRQPGVSFAPATTPEAPRPERELERFLFEIGRDRAAVDFGSRAEITSGWVQIGEGFQAFIRRLEQQVGHYAWVETHGQGRLRARTEVGWTGDSDTFWNIPIVPAQVELHWRTLALALESRQALLHTLVVVSRSAVRLAKLPILLGTPWGAFLAPAAAWKFIQDVRAELEARRARIAW
jgi:hypothetical protein